MKKQARYDGVIDYFLTNVPVAETELTYDNPFQLLVAVILSAQCTDKRVNLTTPGIFKKYPNPETMSKASFDDLFPLVRSISYPNNKTKHLIGTSQLLISKFDGTVPMTIEDLIKLPGVGRKTANVITSVIDQQPNMAVDTHVYRVSRRLGLVPLTAKTPLEVEKQLVKHLPKQHIHQAHHWLILHGRYLCKARAPECWHCPIKDLCRFEPKTPMPKQKKEVAS